MKLESAYFILLLHVEKLYRKLYLFLRQQQIFL